MARVITPTGRCCTNGWKAGGSMGIDLPGIPINPVRTKYSESAAIPRKPCPEGVNEARERLRLIVFDGISGQPLGGLLIPLLRRFAVERQRRIRRQRRFRLVADV